MTTISTVFSVGALMLFFLLPIFSGTRTVELANLNIIPEPIPDKIISTSAAC
jgi:hypothetical protein